MNKTSALLVFTGLPSAGKTTLSKQLIGENCVRLSTDELRREWYGPMAESMKYPLGWEPFWTRLCDLRDEQILIGKNVIIDSCAHSEYIRDKFFNLEMIKHKLSDKRVVVHRYLVNLVVDNDEMIRRFKADGELECGLASIAKMKADFQDPDKYSKPISYLKLSNNTKAEMKDCYRTLRDLLEVKIR